MGGLFDALGITYDTNRNIGRTAYERGEEIKLNPWQKFLGATQEDAENAYKKAQQKDLNSRYGAAMATVGSTGADWGETEQQVMGKIARLTDERAAGQDNKRQAQAVQAAEVAQRPQMAQVDLMREQLLQQAKENNLTRAENAEIRADNLSLERMRMEREDRRYNERMEKLDRQDRRSATQSLVAGLAALGAAFAL